MPYGPVDEYDRIIEVRQGSWARRDAPSSVTQLGTPRLWDVVEEAYDGWCALGRPGRERLGLTVRAHRRQHAWLDVPQSDHVWELAR